MNKLEQAARQVLQHWASSEDLVGAITALREALAEPDIEEMTLTQIAAKYEQAEQEPVAEVENIDEYGPMICWFKHWVGLKVGQKLYAAPVRTKDLTDDEIGSIYEKHHALGGCWTDGFAYERAVIAADRWKNK